MFVEGDPLGIEADGERPFLHCREPGVKKGFPAARRDEVFDFHLFEFDHAEQEVSWCDLVAERFTDLRHAEWDLYTHGIDDVLVVEKNRLRSFGAEVGEIMVTGSRFAEVGREHQIELAYVGPSMGTAFRAGDLIVGDQSVHLD